MSFRVHQKQTKELLEEHAKSSFNFYFFGKHEWIFAVTFILIGLGFILWSKSNLIFGSIGIGIGVYELLKFPFRISRWVSKKTKEKIFNQKILFEISDSVLKVTIEDDDDDEKTEKERSCRYDKMRVCLISKTGILFKISYTQYYYISFKEIEKNYSKMEVIDFIKSQFENSKLKIK